MLRVWVRTETFKKIMARRRLSTLTSFSVRVGVTVQVMSMIVNGRRAVSSKMRDKILNAMKPARWDDLFTFEKPKRANYGEFS